MSQPRQLPLEKSVKINPLALLKRVGLEYRSAPGTASAITANLYKIT